MHVGDNETSYKEYLKGSMHSERTRVYDEKHLLATWGHKRIVIKPETYKILYSTLYAELSKTSQAH